MTQDLLANASLPILYLSYIAVILLVGIIITLITKKFKLPNILFLLIAGIILGHLKYKGDYLISFPAVFLSAVGIVTLAMIVFDVSSKFNIHEIDTVGIRVLKLSSIFLLLCLVFLSLTTKLFFRVSWAHALVFAALMAGTDPGAVLVMFGKAKNRILEILEIESIINTPLTVLFPFMILELSYKFGDVTLSKFDILFEQLSPFLLLFAVGIGVGVLMGIIGSKIMGHYYLRKISPLALITLALLTYILAENLGGNGVLAVTIAGLFYGNLFIKEKIKLFEFSSLFTNFLEILVFVLIGLIIKFPFTFEFIYISLILFLVYLVIRYIALMLTFGKHGLLVRERLFMTLNVQKGIAVAVVAFFLSTLPGLETVLHLTVVFMLYSIILSTLVLPFTKIILNIKEKKEVSEEVVK